MTRALVLMGSGETSPTMVKVHRALLDRVGTAGGGAVVLDTPFGFQSNADELAARAQHYFAESVGTSLGVVSFRSVADVGTAAHEAAMALLRDASYVFAGPGSPTYALRTWRASVVPSLLREKVVAGGSGAVTFASAAALTLGGWTVPVYEIYKVGSEPAWVDGLGLLEAATGLRAAVIPHYNNAEGGTHDTRYCYLGEERLAIMERALPEDAFVLGVDEHTGLVLDLDAGSAEVVGVGGVTLRLRGTSRVVPAGTTMTIESLDPRSSTSGSAEPVARPVTDAAASAASPLVETVRTMESAFGDALGARDVDAAVQAALDLETELQAWSSETFSSDEFDRARAALRGMLSRLGDAARDGVADPALAIAPFVEAVLDARRRARAEGRYADADSLRDHLVNAGVDVHDTPDTTTWTLRDSGEPHHRNPVT